MGNLLRPVSVSEDRLSAAHTAPWSQSLQDCGSVLQEAISIPMAQFRVNYCSCV